MGKDWYRLSTCVTIDIVDGVSNCIFGDVKIISLLLSCAIVGILLDGGGVCMTTFGCIGACGTAIIGEFVMLRSNLFLGVIEGETCRLSGIFAFKSCEVVLGHVVVRRHIVQKG